MCQGVSIVQGGTTEAKLFIQYIPLSAAGPSNVGLSNQRWQAVGIGSGQEACAEGDHASAVVSVLPGQKPGFDRPRKVWCHFG